MHYSCPVDRHRGSLVKVNTDENELLLTFSLGFSQNPHLISETSIHLFFFVLAMITNSRLLMTEDGWAIINQLNATMSASARIVSLAASSRFSFVDVVVPRCGDIHVSVMFSSWVDHRSYSLYHWVRGGGGLSYCGRFLSLAKRDVDPPDQ